MLIQLLEKSIQMDRVNEAFDLGERSIYRFLELIESFMELAKTLCENNFKERQLELDEKQVHEKCMEASTHDGMISDPTQE